MGVADGVDHEDIGSLHVNGEAGHTVDQHGVARTETETVFTGLGARNGEGLVVGLHLGGEIGNLNPLVLSVDASLNHESGVLAAHEGVHTPTPALLGGEDQILTGRHLQGRRHQIGETLITVTARHGKTAGRGALLCGAVFHGPTVGIPAVGHFTVIESLVHLSL